MIGDLSVVGFLKTKMKWHQARQSVLAQNVANGDTPRYAPKDLKPLNFRETLEKTGVKGLQLSATDASHFRMETGKRGAFDTARVQDFEVTPEGNGVNLEDQMMKVAENNFNYQMASSIYSRSIGLIRTALGRNG